MSDQRDRALERLYAQQEKHAEKVKASVQEMKGSFDKGKSATSTANIKKALIAIAVIIFLSMSAVMVADPKSRGPWIFTCFFVVAAGVFFYSKRQSGN